MVSPRNEGQERRQDPAGGLLQGREWVGGEVGGGVRMEMRPVKEYIY